MFGRFRRIQRQQRKVPFEEQLRLLGGCGIGLAPGVRPDALLRSWPREHYESEPFVPLLCALGAEAPDEALAGPHGYPSDDVWHFDTECVYGSGDYARIAARMAVLARGALPLEGVRDHVDVAAGEARLSFRLDGQLHRLDAAVEEDWVDGTVLGRLAGLLASRGAGGGGGRRFTHIDLGGQDCLIGCATPAQRAGLAALTGLEVAWLA